MTNDVLVKILASSQYDLNIFNDSEIKSFLKRIVLKDKKYYIPCVIREKDFALKPEEIVRQLYLQRLISEYQYPKNQIKLEYPVYFGRQIKRADIVVFQKNSDDPYIIVEVKKPKMQDGKEQLKSYTNATGAPIAVWTNGRQISRYNRKDPNYFEEISEIPNANQKLSEILKERFTWKNLVIKDKIPNEGKTLKDLIKDMENEVLANAGVDVFEEVFKLVFTKLYDEYLSRVDKTKFDGKIEDLDLDEDIRNDHAKFKDAISDIKDNKFRNLEFRNKGDTDRELKEKIQNLFERAQEHWKGVFKENDVIQLSPSHLAVCVSSLQDIKLFNSNLQIIDEAFEYLINKSSKGEKGQFFTPRHAIDMCVKMLNPKAGEYMIDTAAGSCGFPVHNIFYFTGKLFSNKDIDDSEKENVLKVFAIDFDEKAVRVARTLNLIAGDGNTNVLHLNTLDYTKWTDKIEQPEWRKVYGDGWDRFRKLQKNKDDFKEYNFNILMANPPFAGDIKEGQIINRYELGIDSKHKAKSKVGRDILFIERNLDFVKAGGRLAIVLPQGRFNNSSDKQIREYIASKARILAVVSLDGNTFKPHTGTKTSVLFLQKWDDKLCPKKEDYPIFFAVSEKSGKDNSGEYVFVKNKDGTKKIDKFGHHIVDHDLHNANENLPDGIAEAFIKFAKKEKFSFWK